MAHLSWSNVSITIPTPNTGIWSNIGYYKNLKVTVSGTVRQTAGTDYSDEEIIVRVGKVNTDPDSSQTRPFYAGGSIIATGTNSVSFTSKTITDYSYTPDTFGEPLKIALYAEFYGPDGYEYISGVQKTITPTITWSNSTLSLTQSVTSKQVTATMGGTASHNLLADIKAYRLFEGTSVIGTFDSNNTVTFTPTVGSHTYKVVAITGDNVNKDGKSATINVVEPAITWSNASLTLSQATTSRQVVATKGGTATHNLGATVTYRLFEGTAIVGTFSGNTCTFTPSAGSHTYKVVAEAGGLTKDGKSATITVVEPAITWSNASLTLSQATTSRQITATKGGTATHSRGITVTYKLYEGTTAIGIFGSNNILTFTPTAGSHTYKTVAEAGGLTKDGTSATISVIEPDITWSNATLTVTQATTSRQITVTKGGTATHSRGETVTYKLYEGTSELGTFSGNVLTLTPTAGSHTYKTVALAGGLTKDGVSASITVVEPAINWAGNSSLVLSSQENIVNAVNNGSATHTRGELVTYYLYEGSTQVATFTNNIATVEDVTEGSHTYMIVAKAGGLSKDGPTATIVISLHRTLNVYINGQFVECIPYRYTNGQFIEIKPYYYQNGNWISCSVS